MVGNRRLSDWLVQTIPDQKKTEEGLRMFLWFTLASTGRELQSHSNLSKKVGEKHTRRMKKITPHEHKIMPKTSSKPPRGGSERALGPHVGPKWKKNPSYFGVVFVLLPKMGIPNL